MHRTPPAPAELARLLLTYEAGANPSPAVVVTAAEHVRLRLREGMTVFLGQTGFDSLWARALYLALQPPNWRASTQKAVTTSWPAGVHGAENGNAPATAPDLQLSTLTSLITLLFTFIGADLGFRLIAQIWPELVLDVPNSRTGADSA